MQLYISPVLYSAVTQHKPNRTLVLKVMFAWFVWFYVMLNIDLICHIRENAAVVEL